MMTRPNRSTVLTLLLLFNHCASQTFGQVANIDVTIHSRVDTSDNEVKAVAALWTNYLISRPDSTYDNPYWNTAEKTRLKDFDLSRAFLYQFPSDELLRYYKPTILTIEREGEAYAIRTIFSADGLEGAYRASNPWCILKLYAVKEAGTWKLSNALPTVTEKWMRTTVGMITFVYPPQHSFNIKLAKKASQFCNQIISEFQFPTPKPFEFYVLQNADELGRLFNFDFFFAGYTTGVGLSDNRMLFSGLGSEYYPHELIHMIVPDNNRHWIIDEGFATWKGGAMDKSFDERAEILATEVGLNDSVTFADVLNRRWGWQYAAAYTTGAIFCKAAYVKGGVALVKKLLETPNDDKKLVEAIGSSFGIREETVNAFWRREVLKFSRKNPVAK